MPDAKLTDEQLDEIEARAAAAQAAFNSPEPDNRKWCSAVAQSHIDSAEDVPALIADVRQLRHVWVAAQRLVDLLPDQWIGGNGRVAVSDAKRALADLLRTAPA